MKKSTSKSVLLSALIFPGSGHIYIRHFKSGFVLLTTTLVAIVILVKQTVDKVTNVLNDIDVTDGTVMNSNEIAELVSQSGQDSLNIAAIIILVCWVVGIVDCIRIGKQQK